MKHVVSVSLGSTARDTDQVVSILGEEVHLERRGTQGDFAAAARLIGELDGHIDAIGLGGIDLFLPVGSRRYYFRDARRLAAAAHRTPVVCGAGLNNSLERAMVSALGERTSWQGRKVLMVSALDRFGMAEELADRGAQVLFGDFIFSLGLPIPLYRLATLHALATVLLPVFVQLPFRWLYPVGSSQESEQTTERFARYYGWADVIAGDWHYIRRYAPSDLQGKVVLTNTTTPADVAFLKARGVRTLITTTPRFDGRSVGTNLLEAAFVAIAGEGRELPAERYREMIERAGLEPSVVELAG
ncbi:MAG: quinate 5-dehydrogenase [Deinococcales bacterium]